MKDLKLIEEELHQFIADKYDEHHLTRNLSKFTREIRVKIEELFKEAREDETKEE